MEDTTNTTETVEEVEDTEVTEVAEEATEATEEVEENISLDDLLNMDAEDYVELADDANHKGMKPLHEWMKNIPEDVRKHIGNLRADYSRKTSAISQERRELEAMKAEMLDMREKMLKTQIDGVTDDIDTDAEYDLFDKEGMQKEIQRQAKLLMKDMLKPAEEKLQVERRQMELSKFKEANPELTDPEYRDEIVALLKSRPELKLEDAFYITKSKVGKTKAQEARDAKAAKKNSRRSTLKDSTPGSRGKVNGKPKFKNAWEAYQWAKAQKG